MRAGLTAAEPEHRGESFRSARNFDPCKLQAGNCAIGEVRRRRAGRRRTGLGAHGGPIAPPRGPRRPGRSPLTTRRHGIKPQDVGMQIIYLFPSGIGIHYQTSGTKWRPVRIRPRRCSPKHPENAQTIVTKRAIKKPDPVHRKKLVKPLTHPASERRSNASGAGEGEPALFTRTEVEGGTRYDGRSAK